jgi:hypothetical protein
MKASEGEVNKKAKLSSLAFDAVPALFGRGVMASYRGDALNASIKVVPQANACPCFIQGGRFFIWLQPCFNKVITKGQLTCVLATYIQRKKGEYGSLLCPIRKRK